MCDVAGQEKRERIQREIEHFAGRLRELSKPVTPQQKRQRTIAGRCLKSRVTALLDHDAKTLSN